MPEYIEREPLLAEYDREHTGSPGRARELIANAPAADVVPARHGRWRLYSPLTDTYECDKCGYQVIDESFRTNYCPNCGAHMGDMSRE